VWSIGCITDFNGREKFNVFFRDLIKSKGAKFPFPEELTIYDYFFKFSFKFFLKKYKKF